MKIIKEWLIIMIWKKKSKKIFYLIPLFQMAYLEYQTFIQEIKILIENGRL